MNIDELLRAILINRIISYNKDREDKLMIVIQSDLATFNKSLSMALDHLAEFKKSNDEAHRYQRDEHKDIMDKINGIK